MEFSTNGRGLLEVFNEVIKLHDKIKPPIATSQIQSRKPNGSKKSLSIKRIKANVVNLVMTNKYSQIDRDGLIALATAGFLFSSIPFVLIAMYFDIDFIWFFIDQVVVPGQYILAYRMTFFMLRFILFFQFIVVTTHLISYKLLILEFVIKTMESNMKILFVRIRKSLSNYRQFHSATLPMYYQMNILVSYCDLSFGNQFSTLMFATTACLIMTGFIVIRLNKIIQIHGTGFVCLLFLCGHVGIQCLLKNAYSINYTSEKIIRECKLRAHTLENTKYWKRKFCSMICMSLALRVGYCRIFRVQKSTLVSFVGFVAIYTINAALGIPINS